MRRATVALVVGAVLVGAGAPMATAQEAPPPTEALLEIEPTAEDWKAFGEELAALEEELAVATTTLAARRPAEWRYDECRFQSLQAGTWTAAEERFTLECAVGHWQIPGGIDQAVAVGNCESGWNRLANNGGRYLGLFQHAASSYTGRVNTYEPAAWDKPLSRRWTNSRGHIVMTVRMVAAGGWGPWSCA